MSTVTTSTATINSSNTGGGGGGGGGSGGCSGSSSNRQQNPISTQTYKIITQYGDMLVVKQGVHIHSHHHQPHGSNQQQAQQSTSKSSNQTSSQQLQEPQTQQQQQQHSTRPVIMTFHDLGLNSELQFATFCETEEVKLMLQTFTMIHVNFIGQEAQNTHTEDLPEDFKYPNIDQMAECIVDVCTQLRVRSFIALAVGAGAHIVSSLALIRPDLVHGLFLINPIISSCSITEWLYFKMSAIASNHYIGGSSSSTSETSSTAGSNQSNQTSSADSPKKHQSGGGFRKLLNAAHISMPHHHHHHHSKHNHSGSGSGSKHKGPGDELGSSASESQASESSGNLTSLNDDCQSVTSSKSVSGGLKSHHQHGPTASRLRRLILSRNFHLNQQPPQPQPQPQPSQHKTLARAESLTSGSENSPAGQSKGGPETSSIRERSATSSSAGKTVKSASCDSSESINATTSTGSTTAVDKLKRPPVEYLMYHHFGSATIQRYRRPSADAHSPLGDDSPEIGVDRKHKGRCQDNDERQSNSSRHSSQSHDSLAQYKAAAASAASGKRRGRSNSVVCLSAHYLASFSNDRQRAAYMQSVYKQYFAQINAHNLWLFAHSFVKRRALNLRKDCGAAAHAAAAAAALGTSICTAFVGTAPAQQGNATNLAQQSAQAQASPAIEPQQTSINQTEQILETRRASAGDSQPGTGSKITAAQQQAKCPHALVAGTKVKRTFTCQTLIMCSSVPMHCERAFKLMSLLNPLQATCIKTDQLLVLEEKPEKVCQALRLFLQGIGYSMSTYERRLRLSSAQGSVSSADSTSSARSLSEKF